MGLENLGNVFTDAFEFWKTNWQKLIISFGIILAVQIVSGFISFFISIFTLIIDAFFPPAGTLLSMPISLLISIVSGAISTVIIFSLWKQIWEVMNGREMPEIVKLITAQWWKGLAIAIVQNILSFVASLGAIGIGFAVAVGVAVIVPILTANNQGIGQWSPILILLGFAIAFAIVLVALLIQAIIFALLTFWNIEVSVAEKGILEGAAESVTKVVKNPVEVIVYTLIWFAIGLVVSIVSTVVLVCTLCIATPLLWVVEPLLIMPLRMVTLLYLWKLIGEAPVKGEK